MIYDIALMDGASSSNLLNANAGPVEAAGLLSRDRGLTLDAGQQRALQRLQALHEVLNGYDPTRYDAGWRSWFGISRKPNPPRGLYIWGSVGRGKSMLMDLFFATAPVAHKRRVHFHAFMLEVQDRLHHQRQTAKGDPIPPVATAIAQEVHLLCFDEFQVTNIADAMILARLFEGFFDNGIIVVATSNRPPDDLYRDGLQRERVIPFIELLKDRLEVLELSGDRDYRLARLAGRPVFFSPLGDRSDSALDALWAELTDGATGEAARIALKKRFLPVPRQARGVARFEFEELCARPVGAADYLALARAYHTLIIDDVPVLGPARYNEAKRFNTLVDELYEAKTRLIMSMAAPPAQLYEVGEGSWEFMRTVSRLNEMQSETYLSEAREGALPLDDGDGPSP